MTDVLKFNTKSQGSSQRDCNASERHVPLGAKSALIKHVKKFLKIVNGC
jgi:hypothetical protein